MKNPTPPDPDERYVAKLTGLVESLSEEVEKTAAERDALLARVKRLEWIVDQYGGFCFWHSYIPSPAELGERYDREHAAKQPAA